MLTALGIVKSYRIWSIRSQAPKHVMFSVWGRFNDWMEVGVKELITLNERLRYSLTNSREFFDVVLYIP